MTDDERPEIDESVVAGGIRTNYLAEGTTWADQVVVFLDALSIPKASLVGNSFGGAIALRVATRHPDRVDRLVLMGSVGVPFPITAGLDAAWGYEPSVQNMRRLLEVFAYSRELVTDELAQVRYEASIQPGFQESFVSMFPPPRQRHVDAMATADEEIAKLPHQTLVATVAAHRALPVARLRPMRALDLDRAQRAVQPTSR